MTTKTIFNCSTKTNRFNYLASEIQPTQKNDRPGEIHKYNTGDKFNKRTVHLFIMSIHNNSANWKTRYCYPNRWRFNQCTLNHFELFPWTWDFVNNNWYFITNLKFSPHINPVSRDDISCMGQIHQRQYMDLYFLGISYHPCVKCLYKLYLHLPRSMVHTIFDVFCNRTMCTCLRHN